MVTTPEPGQSYPNGGEATLQNMHNCSVKN